MEYDNYSLELASALKSFGSTVDSGKILGDGAAQFLGVTKGSRGCELYRGDQNKIIIDPALDEELQGEITFNSYEAAIQAATLWLGGCEITELKDMEEA